MQIILQLHKKTETAKCIYLAWSEADLILGGNHIETFLCDKKEGFL